MIILGIETSCDETGVAVLSFDKGQNEQKGIQILSNVLSSSASLQAKYGGIIPEQAAREQIKSIISVIEESLQLSTYNGHDIDAIAVTFGPGLIGSLLVGVETAKTLATVWEKPLIPINHLIGHFYANWVGESVPSFPCLGLLVSGGHTDLVIFKNHGTYTYLGGTRDDAAGECFDKCARLLGLPYPGGPQIAELAKLGDPNKFKLPIPMTGRKDFDFSYSGLKTSVSNTINHKPLTIKDKQNLAASIEETIVKSLIEKIVLAIQKYKVEQLMVAGGVAANHRLTAELTMLANRLKIKLHVPEQTLCTDNAAMIAAAGFFTKPLKHPLLLQANPNLHL